MDSYLGEIRLFAGNFAPLNWALCNGATLQVRQYPALYSILGTRYGGNGTTTFNLPNLQANVPMGMGSGPGLTPRSLGNQGGSTSVQLNGDQLAFHSHTVNSLGGENTAKVAVPNGGYPASSQKNRQSGAYEDTPYETKSDKQMNPTMVQPAGGSNGSAAPHNNMQPFLALNFIISLAGYFPGPAAA